MNASITPPAPLDIYENTLVHYVKHSRVPRLESLRQIWGERNYLPPQYVPLWHLAECMGGMADRFSLLCCGGGYPVFPGWLGVYADAAPGRKWATGLQYDEGELSEDDRHWARLIAVLSSRIMLAKISDLPGYDGDVLPMLEALT
jgi:hypothetical protein